MKEVYYQLSTEVRMPGRKKTLILPDLIICVLLENYEEAHITSTAFSIRLSFNRKLDLNRQCINGGKCQFNHVNKIFSLLDVFILCMSILSEEHHLHQFKYEQIISWVKSIS